jgi:2-polyprenyl-6-hydroxyphenyl methylase/3-demethylubiquinone-9 3-methyltransferase
MKDKHSYLKNLHEGNYVLALEKKSLNRIARLMKYVKLSQHSVVADYGCGNGMLLSLIHNKISEYYGIDFSSGMLSAAKKRAEKLSFSKAFFYNADIADFSKEFNDFFDIAFALDFSEHVDDEDWLKILASVRKTLKKGGLLYLHTPNKEYLLEFLKDKGVLKQFPQHIAVRTLSDNLMLLEMAGFTKVNFKLLSHYQFFQKPLHLLSFLPYIGRFFKARIFLCATK